MKKQMKEVRRIGSNEIYVMILNVLQMLINNNSVNSDIDANLRHLLIDEEVENIKKENVETKKDLQILKIKIFDLKQMWKTHIQVGREEIPVRCTNLTVIVVRKLSSQLTGSPALSAPWLLSAHQRNCSAP